MNSHKEPTKPKVSQETLSKLHEQAQIIGEMSRTEGWKLVSTELTQQLDSIRDLLVENRLKTVTETMTIKDGTKSFTVSAEEQKAEHAGMYKMAKYILNLVDEYQQKPTQLENAIREGYVLLEGEVRHE